jgi:CRISPR system Cascade subunit CasC
MQWGGVERGRVSSAAQKRAIRTSAAFQKALEGHLGQRTARLLEIVEADLLKEGVKPDKARAAATSVAAVFGKVEEGGTKAKQMAFISPEEVVDATKLARRIAQGEAVSDKELDGLLRTTTTAVDVAMFGRMFADRGEIRMTAACEVAHPFTVDRAALDVDFFVATDDRKLPEEDTGAQYLDEQSFLAGLFYGYARIDMGQLERNLGGKRDLAMRAAKAFIRGALTVSPTGKKASFGTNALASWAMIERGPDAPRSLAAAFLKPVRGDDHLAEAVRRAEALAESMDFAYGSTWTRKTMLTSAEVVGKPQGSLMDMLALVDAFPKA